MTFFLLIELTYTNDWGTCTSNIQTIHSTIFCLYTAAVVLFWYCLLYFVQANELIMSEKGDNIAIACTLMVIPLLLLKWIFFFLFLEMK